jgi:hypothetical protein
MKRFGVTLSRALRARRGASEFLRLPPEQRKIVFYSEDDYSFLHFDALIRELTGRYGHSICYLTSQQNDPILTTNRPRVRPFFIGEGWTRTSLFMRMDARTVVMTMPDLETYHLKRSRVADVHYVYLFHAMVSTHSNYREFAFDNYDTILLTGPYQRDEVRATEQAYGLPQKHLVEYGYPHLEKLIEDARRWRATHVSGPGDGPPRVLLAPTWGPNAILEAMGASFVSRLLAAGIFVTVRPHPVTTRKRPDLIEDLRARFGDDASFRLETDIRSQSTLYEADLMICDWSGVSMEYAFSCERPVLFIDLPKKLNNPNADRIGMTPVETSIRHEIGEVISPDDLDALPEAIGRCIRNRDAYIDKIRDLRSRYVFNLNRSAEVGARYIHELAERAES